MSDEPVHARNIAQDQMVELGIHGLFDVTIHLNAIDWPRSWTSLALGKFYSGLYRASKSSLRTLTPLDEIKKIPFVVPMNFNKTHFYYGSDGYPVPVRERIIGSEVSSANLAVEVISRSNQLAFLPERVARDAVAQGLIRKIEVKE